MRDIRNTSIPFIENRRIMFAISAVLIAISIAALIVRGLTFGIEFQGGTSMDFIGTGDVTVEQLRSALDEAGETGAVIQSSESQQGSGFLVRTSTVDPAEATAKAHAAAAAVGLPESSVQVTTIGPDWGANVTKSSLLAFVVSIGLIIVYISIRFEFKMSLTAVASLFHDLIIVFGVYALFGREITPNTIAALLTIMGYSLYDTVVVFGRILENARETEGTQRTFFDVANKSINQVLVRSINTSLTSFIPVLVMFLFGGETLKDFAFAMSLGLILGAYSSIGISTPLYALWKTREPEWAKKQKRADERAAVTEAGS